ncbi:MULTISPECIES: DUF397 domain-containing protein [unclassified Streptomyces]|uniref:DUF397 domain-containing protein n=1 Tax=unclassified Streptomyces TaxID=2593676 RepID=UPI00081B1B27|nr:MULTISPECIES: DUF397 domain-containing protein [unclassified Streptomyces]MEE1843452.1 DUF397 domain-containing protein [Streptomyces sp. JV190]MYQ85286.1 DUF397 domain-containing protein [Streptomyces sp. SID4936]SCE02382.1 protein of unknown function [Streptomyces sp. DvalAA-43]
MSSQEVVSPFVKSSFSGGGSANECVEVAHTADGGRAVRDSKNRDGGLQFYAPEGWSAFLDGVKGGAFGG